jgi:hypothetical protein
VHSFYISIFDFLDIDQFAFAPESDFSEFTIKRVNAKINLFSWIGGDFELEIVNRDFSIGIYHSIYS